MSHADKLKAKYGQDYYKNIRAKVKKPGFKAMDAERVKQISAKGVAARKALRESRDEIRDIRASAAQEDPQ